MTLLELLIVVLIIGVLATIAVPKIQAYIWKARFAEVYTMIGTIVQMEEIYYQEHGHYTENVFAQCYAGNGIPAGSTQVQVDLDIEIPEDCFFEYLIYPCDSWPNSKHVYFGEPGYMWAWSYDYEADSWAAYTTGDGGPARKYFVPPGTR